MWGLISNELLKIRRKKKFLIVTIALMIITSLGCYGVYKDREQRKPENELARYESRIEYLKNQKDEKGLSEEKKQKIDLDIKMLEKQSQQTKNSMENKDLDWKKTLEDKNKALKIQKEELEKQEQNEEAISLDNRIKENQYYIDHNIKPSIDYEVSASEDMLKIQMIINLVFLAIIVVVLTSDIVSGECTPATMKMLLTKPVSRSKILLSKFFAAIISATGIVIGVELITYLVLGIVFKFGSLKMPMAIGMKYANDPAQIAQYGMGVKLIPSSVHIAQLWQVTLNVTLIQILFIIATVSFCTLISTIVNSSTVSITICFLIISVLDIVNFKVMAAGVSYKITNKIIPFIFTTYCDGISILTGMMAPKIKSSLINSTTAVTVLIAWIIICYVLADRIFNKKDMLI